MPNFTDAPALLGEVNSLLSYEGVDPADSLDEALDRLAEVDVNLETRGERARGMASRVRTMLDAIEHGDL